MTELGRHEDERGVIQDLLLGPIGCVTEITTKAGAVRGNHVHDRTSQWVYIVSGLLLGVTEAAGVRQEHVYGPGDMAEDPPAIPHAWKALGDTTVLVFTKGPRSGEDYETDTRRLAVPLL